MWVDAFAILFSSPLWLHYGYCNSFHQISNPVGSGKGKQKCLCQKIKNFLRNPTTDFHLSCPELCHMDTSGWKLAKKKKLGNDQSNLLCLPAKSLSIGHNYISMEWMFSFLFFQEIHVNVPGPLEWRKDYGAGEMTKSRLSFWSFPEKWLFVARLAYAGDLGGLEISTTWWVRGETTTED